jgi:hypothetical protein
MFSQVTAGVGVRHFFVPGWHPLLYTPRSPAGFSLSLFTVQCSKPGCSRVSIVSDLGSPSYKASPDRWHYLSHVACGTNHRVRVHSCEVPYYRPSKGRQGSTVPRILEGVYGTPGEGRSASEARRCLSRRSSLRRASSPALPYPIRAELSPRRRDVGAVPYRAYGGPRVEPFDLFTSAAVVHRDAKVGHI